MKKSAICVFTATFAIVLGSFSVSAAGHGYGRQYHRNENESRVCQNSGQGYYFTDIDQDGICDYRAAKENHCSFTDADQDGICDYCQQMIHSFTDTDQDGICDHLSIRSSFSGVSGHLHHGSFCPMQQSYQNRT